MDILFSIIIPTLNEEQFIAKTLDSIVSQKHRGIKQIIVSDNGSTDETVAIAKKFGAVVVADSKLYNIGSARKVGCAVAKKLAKKFGSVEEIIVTTDADTILAPGYLDSIYKLYSGNSQIVASSGPYKIVINNRVFKLGKFFHKANLVIGAIDLQLWWLLRKVKANALLYGFNTVIRRSTYDSIGGFDELSTGEDMDLTLKVISAGYSVFYEGNQCAETSARKLTNKDGVFKFKKAYQYVFQREGVKQAKGILQKKFKQHLPQ